MTKITLEPQRLRAKPYSALCFSTKPHPLHRRKNSHPPKRVEGSPPRSPRISWQNALHGLGRTSRPDRSRRRQENQNRLTAAESNRIRNRTLGCREFLPIPVSQLFFSRAARMQAAIRITRFLPSSTTTSLVDSLFGRHKRICCLVDSFAICTVMLKRFPHRTPGGSGEKPVVEYLPIQSL